MDLPQELLVGLGLEVAPPRTGPDGRRVGRRLLLAE